MAKRTCKEPGCERPHCARGWCKMHYYQWRNSDQCDPADIAPRNPGAICSEDGCERKAWALGLCTGHYRRRRRLLGIGPKCSIEGCTEVVAGLGWCQKHYGAYRRYGDPLGVADRPTREELFWSHVDKRGPDECWPWTGSRISLGYGSFGVGSRLDGTRGTVPAHRFSWELHHGPIPDGLEVCHECDHPWCVNPDGKNHLILGTHKRNMEGMAERGRSTSKGEPFMDAEHVAIREQQRRSRVAKKTGGNLIPTPQPCGTVAAYNRHLNHGETPCEECRLAARAHEREWREKRRA